jgi:hypothetical protein
MPIILERGNKTQIPTAIFCLNVSFYRKWALCARRETTYNNQLRILIGLERNCQQMRWLVENEIPTCSME